MLILKLNCEKFIFTCMVKAWSHGVANMGKHARGIFNTQNFTITQFRVCLYHASCAHASAIACSCSCTAKAQFNRILNLTKGSRHAGTYSIHAYDIFRECAEFFWQSVRHKRFPKQQKKTTETASSREDSEQPGTTCNPFALNKATLAELVHRAENC